MDSAQQTGRALLSVAPVQPYGSVSTTGSTPAVVQRQEASEQENAKYEIGAMIKNRMSRLLVVCDMNGADLREIIGPRVSQLNIHDGRSVMREAILAEMNRLNRDVARRLDQAWP